MVKNTLTEIEDLVAENDTDDLFSDLEEKPKKKKKGFQGLKAKKKSNKEKESKLKKKSNNKEKESKLKKKKRDKNKKKNENKREALKLKRVQKSNVVGIFSGTELTTDEIIGENPDAYSEEFKKIKTYGPGKMMEDINVIKKLTTVDEEKNEEMFKEEDIQIIPIANKGNLEDEYDKAILESSIGKSELNFDEDINFPEFYQGEEIQKKEMQEEVFEEEMFEEEMFEEEEEEEEGVVLEEGEENTPLTEADLGDEDIDLPEFKLEVEEEPKLSIEEGERGEEKEREKEELPQKLNFGTPTETVIVEDDFLTYDLNLLKEEPKIEIKENILSVDESGKSNEKNLAYVPIFLQESNNELPKANSIEEALKILEEGN